MIIAYFSVSFKLGLIEKNSAALKNGKKNLLKREIKFSNRYEWFKIEDFDNLKISASNVSSKSLGILLKKQITWQTIKSPECKCLARERPVWADGCPIYVAYILVCVTYAQVCLLWKAVMQQPVMGPTLAYHSFFYLPSNKILSGSMESWKEECEGKSVY